MRLEPIAPSDLTAEQRPLHESMQEGIRKHLHGFIAQREDGAVIGPFPAMLHFPQFGAAAWSVFTALSENSTLPNPAHEVAILVTGARLNSRYELYSHERVAKLAGLSESKIATITAGQRPADLSAEEGIAYDVAACLSNGGQLHDTTYKAAVEAFGKDGTAELVYLIGCYSMISILLNAYDVPLPE
ncbi:MAG: carboxymuconolactone decarboxylase family protein [Janthinobacterium lividum]